MTMSLGTPLELRCLCFTRHHPKSQGVGDEYLFPSISRSPTDLQLLGELKRRRTGLLRLDTIGNLSICSRGGNLSVVQSLVSGGVKTDRTSRNRREWVLVLVPLSSTIPARRRCHDILVKLTTKHGSYKAVILTTFWREHRKHCTTLSFDWPDLMDRPE